MFKFILNLFRRNKSTKQIAKRNYKKRDGRKITYEEYDVICEMYRQHLENKRKFGKHYKLTAKDITAMLNDRLSLDKSTTSYSNVWHGHVLRETCILSREA